MKQINIETKTQSQNHQSIGASLALDNRFILKQKPTGSFALNQSRIGGTDVNLSKGPPGRMPIPVKAYCLNPGNLEAMLPELVERRINTTINYNLFINTKFQLFTNINYLQS